MKDTLCIYKISADNRKSYTEQWLTKEDAEKCMAMGYIVEQKRC